MTVTYDRSNNVNYAWMPLYGEYKAPEAVETGDVHCTVYFRDKGGKLSAVKAVGAEDHEDAIISTKELLISGSEFWEGPMLAVITGGKK